MIINKLKKSDKILILVVVFLFIILLGCLHYYPVSLLQIESWISNNPPKKYKYCISQEKDSQFQFSTNEKKFIQNTLEDKRGWSHPQHGNYYFISVTEEQEPDVIIYLKSRKEMQKLFPQAHLQGLSVTMMGIKPKRIFLDYNNWNTVPSKFDGNIHTYRQYLIQHEMGHAIEDKPHQSPPNNSKLPCPVMYQQTRGTIGVCQPNPWISLQQY